MEELNNKTLRIIFTTLTLAILLLFIIAILENFFELRYDFKHIRKLHCRKTRWGCCPDHLTVRLDPWGTNCVPRPLPDYRRCYHSYYGCCEYPPWVAKRNLSGTNCLA